MWAKNRVQSTSKTSGQTKSTNLQHLSPFASHSSAGSPSLTSQKTVSELPSGVRYVSSVRQTPTSLYRSVANRPNPSTVTKRRERSPEKNLRFAEPTQCTRKHDKTDGTAAAKPSVRTRSTSRDRKLVRPVITAEPTPAECKRFSSHNQKVVATSPATRQTSPIFSTVDFGGDTNRTSTSKQSPNAEQMPRFRSSDARDTTSNRFSVTPVTNQRSVPEKPSDRQPIIKTEITTPNGNVLKRSSAVTSKVGPNGAVHRNTVSFPIQTSGEHNMDQRLSVNVNVAVGLDCNDNGMSRFTDQRYNNYLETDLESERVDQSEDEVDWAPLSDYGKGFAMQVAVRLRPFVQSEIDSKNDISVIEMNGNTVRIINSDNDNYNRMEYGFDVCLNSSDRDLFGFADQDTVFKRMGEPLLERSLEGYNVCLFAYGQTGSGKSFTMTGTDQNPGIIPRFVHELYKRILNLTEVLFAVEVSYYEIYNEKIYDLLSDDKDNNKKILRIREHPQTGPYVENLSQHTVDGYDEIMQLLRSGTRRRANASTAANADSSRSHSIFTIILSQLKNNSDEMGLDMSSSCGSRINLIDLAGSERVGHSGTSGDRLREGSLINKSLLNLGKVISKLAEYSANPVRTAHIPYRDSALTWLLKESLGGNSQTSMIATISPAKCHLEETLSTIRYAAKARQIVNFVHINEDPKTKKIRELMEIIAELRAQHRREDLDPKDIPIDIPRDSPTSSSLPSKTTSDESKDSSFDSQTSENKKIETKSIATNTSFVSDRRTSTKGTDPAWNDLISNDKKKNTATIATNTSFIELPKKCSTGTETLPIKSPPKEKPKPKTATTGTETSFIGPNHVDTSTNTSFVELPSRLDLLRFKKLEEQEKQLLADIRKHKEKLFNELNRKVEEWEPISSSRSQNGDPVLDPVSDNASLDYYDAEDVIDSAKCDNTYVVSLHSVDTTNVKTVFTSQDVKQSYDKSSAKKKDKKEKKDKKKDKKKECNEWQTEDKNKTEEKTNECNNSSDDWNKPSDDWNKPLEQIEEVNEENLSPHKSDTVYDDWGTQEDNTVTEKKDNNKSPVNKNAGQTIVTQKDGTTGDWDNTENSSAKKDKEKKDKKKKDKKNTFDESKHKAKDQKDEWGSPDKQEEQNKSWPTGDTYTKDEWTSDAPQKDNNDWGTDNNKTDEKTKEEDNWDDCEQNKGDDTNQASDDKKDNTYDGWGPEEDDKTVEANNSFDWSDNNQTVINNQKVDTNEDWDNETKDDDNWDNEESEQKEEKKDTNWGEDTPW